MGISPKKVCRFKTELLMQDLLKVGPECATLITTGKIGGDFGAIA